jgi:hypothetical protein
MPVTPAPPTLGTSHPVQRRPSGHNPSRPICLKAYPAPPQRPTRAARRPGENHLSCTPLDSQHRESRPAKGPDRPRRCHLGLKQMRCCWWSWSPSGRDAPSRSRSPARTRRTAPASSRQGIAWPEQSAACEGRHPRLVAPGPRPTDVAGSGAPDRPGPSRSGEADPLPVVMRHSMARQDRTGLYVRCGNTSAEHTSTRRIGVMRRMSDCCALGTFTLRNCEIRRRHSLGGVGSTPSPPELRRYRYPRRSILGRFCTYLGRPPVPARDVS